jgi:Rrf2 family protein
MLSLTTEYALRAATCLAAHGPRLLTSQHIAAATHVPVRYLSKVLQTLTEAELLISQRGPAGGFALSRDPATITLLDVVRAVEPIARVRSCPLGLAEHACTLCPLHAALDDLGRFAEDHLRARTLQDMIEQRVVPLGLKPGGS